MTTQQMQVENTAFLIEKLASDCAPLQYIRELTKNSIEAIQARQDAGDVAPGVIEWDVDWLIAEEKGVFKLQIVDNGTGMSSNDMEYYINSLSSSGRIQSLTENFGMGAKITAGVENPSGLVYKSWFNGQGHLCHLWKDQSQHVYGLKQFQLPNGDFAHIVPLSSEVKPNTIDQHGTAVVLLGKFDDEHTMKPEGQPLKWLIKYLNSRFYALPENITIKVRDFSKSDPSDWPTSPTVGMTGGGGSQMRTIRGMRDHLVEKSVSHGITSLSDATVRWFILPAEGIQQRDLWQSTAHIAALYQDELYEMKAGRTSLARIREFGMVFGSDRVVIYVEPDTSKLNVMANIGRSALILDGDELPWTRWAGEFRAQMPDELQEMMNEIVSAVEGRDHKDAIRRRLREIRELMRISRYRRSASGHVPIGGNLPGGEPRADGSTRAPKSGSNAGGGGSVSDIYGAYIQGGTETGIELADRSNEPEVRWVSRAEGTRSDADDLDDRAASFVRASNLILANRDFRVFQDMIREVATRYPESEETATQVKDTVEEWFEQQLIEAVMGVLAMQGSPAWDNNTIEKALSAEALTTAVMPRYSTYRMITRALGARLGAAPGASTP